MLTDFQKQKLINLFEVHDVTRDGYLSRADHEAQAARLSRLKGWEQGSPQHQRLLTHFMVFWEGLRSTADVNDDAPVDLNEWYRYWDTILSSDALFAEVIQPIAISAMMMMDHDNDGKVAVKEYASIHDHRGLPETAASESFTHLDLDSDGYISIEEGVTLIEQYFSSNDPESPGNWFFGPWKTA